MKQKDRTEIIRSFQKGRWRVLIGTLATLSESINLQVAYTANAVGIQTATLTVNSNAANSTALTINLRGIGTTGLGATTNAPALLRSCIPARICCSNCSNCPMVSSSPFHQ